jgi:hypothetical protein
VKSTPGRMRYRTMQTHSRHPKRHCCLDDMVHREHQLWSRFDLNHKNRARASFSRSNWLLPVPQAGRLRRRCSPGSREINFNPREAGRAVSWTSPRLSSQGRPECLAWLQIASIVRGGRLYSGSRLAANGMLYAVPSGASRCMSHMRC